MNDLILHHLTRTQLRRFIGQPTHALLLTGPAGMGKTAIAQALSAEILGAPLAAYPYYRLVQSDSASISIDSIRELQKFLLLKTLGSRPIRRVVVIEYAHTMTTEAQNAFLKLLEEPPADTLLILTSTNPRMLLPTILSRTQHIPIQMPAEHQLKPLMAASGKAEQTAQQAYFLSGGLPGLLHALLTGEEEHPLLASVDLAKQLLQKSPFERLAMVDALSKQKESALGLIEALERIAKAGLAGASAKHDTARIRQWHQVRKSSLAARNALRQNANAKLTLTHLLLCIS